MCNMRVRSDSLVARRPPWSEDAGRRHRDAAARLTSIGDRNAPLSVRGAPGSVEGAVVRDAADRQVGSYSLIGSASRREHEGVFLRVRHSRLGAASSDDFRRAENSAVGMRSRRRAREGPAVAQARAVICAGVKRVADRAQAFGRLGKDPDARPRSPSSASAAASWARASGLSN